VTVITRHVGVLLTDSVEGSLPQIAGEREHVRLRTQRELLALAATRELEGVADAALDTLARVHTGLEGHLIRCVLLEEAAGACVHAFGVLPHNDEVDVGGSLAHDR
jgi:hypothetical protein